MQFVGSRSLRFALTLGLALAWLTACAVDSPTFTGMIDAADGDAGTTDGGGDEVSLAVSKIGTAGGTVSSNPGGIDCGATCTASFPRGAMVTLTAMPDADAAFAGWTGACVGNAPTCTVTLDAATTVTATFNVAQYLVTVDLTGSGVGSVAAAAAGIGCPTACETQVAHGTQLRLTAAADPGSEFVGWTVSGGGTPCAGTGACVTTVTGATTIVATFARNQSLEVTRSGNGNGTVTSAPTGINCGADCSEQFPPASSVTLTATPAADSNFVGWTGGGCAGTGPCTVVVSGATLVTAEFALKQYTLTVTKAGLGAGTVASTPAGVNCGATCGAQFNAGTVITLTASPTAGSVFAGWSGGGCTGTASCMVALAGATTVTATFSPILHTLTVLRSGAGAGTVVSSPAGVSCGADCTEDFAQGAMVTLTATPNAGSTFVGWSGAACTGTGACAITMSAAATVTAMFTATQVTLTIAKAGTGTGSVSSSPAGIACGADCSEPYAVGTGVTLSAAANAGSTFAGWSGGGCTGTGTCTVAMAMATTVTATFTLDTFPVTVSKAGTGAGTVTSTPAGINCGADCAETWAYGTAVTLTAAPSAGSTFTGWSGGGCTGTGTCALTVAASTAVTATFAINSYTLTAAKTGAGGGTVTSSPAGISCGADCTESITHGAMVTLTATPAGGSIFSGWSGGGCAGTGSCVVTVTAATTVTAAFALAPFALSVSKAGTGAGTVTSSPAGINCGADCTEPYTNGTSVTLTATPTAGSTFAGWSGGGCTGTGTCTVSITAAISVTATFTLNTYPLGVTKAGTGAGTVTSSPAGISCGGTCSANFGHGTTVTLTAAPTTGSSFAGWSGAGCSGTGTCAVTVTAAASVTATFTLNTYPLTVTKGGTGYATITSSPAGISCGATCSASFGHGTTVTLTATATIGSTFTGWSGAGCSGTGTCTVAMTAAASVTANIAINSYTLAVALAGSGAGTVTSTPAGISCGADCAETVGHGTVLTLSASPLVGSSFAGWSGGGCTGTGTCTVTVTAATSVTATFTLNSYTLSVATAGSGGGTVTSTPAGINCGATCAAGFTHGTSVTLTAAPNGGSTFSGWSGGGCAGTGPCTVSMTSATTVTATFTANLYTLTVWRNGSGTVTSTPAGITCATGCTSTAPVSAQYPFGTLVTLDASDSGLWFWSDWGGACAGQGPSCTLTIDSDLSTNAIFIRDTGCDPICP